jgi:hypothetical protein
MKKKKVQFHLFLHYSFHHYYLLVIVIVYFDHLSLLLLLLLLAAALVVAVFVVVDVVRVVVAVALILPLFAHCAVLQRSRNTMLWLFAGLSSPTVPIYVESMMLSELLA